MSFNVKFAFSTGINRTLYAPKGTLEKINKQIQETSNQLNITDWRDLGFNKFETVSDKVLCSTAGEHNNFISWLWKYGFPTWTPKPTEKNIEKITKKNRRRFLGFFERD